MNEQMEILKQKLTDRKDRLENTECRSIFATGAHNQVAELKWVLNMIDEIENQASTEKAPDFCFKLSDEWSKRFPSSNFLYSAKKNDSGYLVSWTEFDEESSNQYSEEEVSKYLAEGCWVIA